MFTLKPQEQTTLGGRMQKVTQVADDHQEDRCCWPELALGVGLHFAVVFPYYFLVEKIMKKGIHSKSHRLEWLQKYMVHMVNDVAWVQTCCEIKLFFLISTGLYNHYILRFSNLIHFQGFVRRNEVSHESHEYFLWDSDLGSFSSTFLNELSNWPVFTEKGPARILLGSSALVVLVVDHLSKYNVRVARS